MNPTAPPESLGSPSARTYRIPARIASSSRIGSFVPRRTSVFPPRVIVTRDWSARNRIYGSNPMKEYRAHFSPPSTLSRRKWSSGNRAAIFRYADTGVSRSAWNSCQTGMTAPGTPALARKTSMSGIVITVGSSPQEKRVHLIFRLQFPDRPVRRVAVRVRADDNLVVISRLSARPLHHSRLPSVFFEPFPKRLGHFPVPEGGHLDHPFRRPPGMGRSRVGSRFPGCRLHEENGGGLLLRQGFAEREALFGLCQTRVCAGGRHGGNLSRLLGEGADIFPDLRIVLLPDFDRSRDLVRLVSSTLCILLDDPAHLEADDESHRKKDDGSDHEEGKLGSLPLRTPEVLFLIVQRSHIRSGADTPIRESPVETTFLTALAIASRPWVRSGVSPRNRWL